VLEGWVELHERAFSFRPLNLSVISPRRLDVVHSRVL
jgi:hypothetical protein